MFIDGQTGKSVGPRIKPVMIVTETREKSYTNLVEDPETGTKSEVISSGWEIVKEIAVAPVEHISQIDANSIRSLWRAKHGTVVEHAKRCKKQLTSECPTCLKNIELMSACPAHILSEVLA